MITEQKKWEDGQLKLVKSQDVTRLLDYNKHLSETHVVRGDMKHVGSIPEVVAQQWQTECGKSIGTAEFAEYAKRKLMSSDWSGLRVWNGKL